MYKESKKKKKKGGVGVPFSDEPQITHVPLESSPNAF